MYPPNETIFLGTVGRGLSWLGAKFARGPSWLRVDMSLNPVSGNPPVWGTLNFVCYIGWTPASSVYPHPLPAPAHKKKKKKKKISSISAIWYLSYTKNKYLQILAYPKKYSSFFLFKRCGFHLFFL